MGKTSKETIPNFYCELLTALGLALISSYALVQQFITIHSVLFMSAIQQCLVCSSSDIHVLKGYEKHHLSKCRSCGFVFANLRPTLEELTAHYDGYGRNDYLSPITIKRYEEILDEFEPFRTTGNLLDIGCGIGYFLEVAKRKGWNVYGTEYTDKAIEINHQKGITVHQGKLDAKNYPAGFFDVVTSFEVIEHINNPIEEVGEIKAVLRKGGLFYCTTPNFNALNRYQLKADYNIICYPEHLSYYTPSTLKRLFVANGFAKKKILSTGFSITRIKTSKGQGEQVYIAEHTDDEKIRRRIEGNPLLQVVKSIINGMLTAFGAGITLKGYFIKK